MIDSLNGRPVEDRWEGGPDATSVDRPGIVASILRYWLVVLAAMVLGAVVGYGIAQRLPVRYQAEAVLILSDPGGPSVLGGGSVLESDDRQVYLDKQVAIMTSSVTLDRALELLGSRQSPRDVKGQLDVQPAETLASISIVATSAEPRSAAQLANAVATAYEQITQERRAADTQRALASLAQLRSRYQAEIDASPQLPDGRLTSRQQQLAGQIADIQHRELEITVEGEVSASGVEYFERAEPPASPSQPKIKLAVVLGGLLGLLAAGAFAWWAAARRPARRGPERTGPDPRGAVARRGATTTRPAGGDQHIGHSAGARSASRGRLSPRRRLDRARVGRSRRKVGRHVERRAGSQ